MAQLTARRSTIFISAGDGIQVFHSVGEVPARLRKQLHETTHSTNSATILIADRQGREELVRALQGEPSSVQCRLADTIRAKQNVRAAQENPISSPPKALRPWVAAVFLLITCASIWFALEMHF